MPRKPTPKKKFEDKFFEDVDGKWKPKNNEGWQIKDKVDYPKDEKGEIEPWADHLRIWMFEMNQWAETVTQKLDELERRVSADVSLSGAPTQGGPE